MRKELLLLLFASLTNFSYSQSLFKNVVISHATSGEPSICVNYTNTNHIVAASNIQNVYYSTDKGHTWIEDQITSPELGVWGDPCIINDNDGSFYYFHLSSPSSDIGSWIDRIVCQRLDDIQSREWTSGKGIYLNSPKQQDKEWAIVDPITNNIYVTWTEFDEYGSPLETDHSRILFSMSSDKGESWSEPVILSDVEGICIDNDNTTEGAVPTVGPNGEIYVSWSYGEKIYFNKSSDQGETWLDEASVIEDQPGGWDYDIPNLFRCNGMPITTCDISNSPNRGTIYINWTDQRNGVDDTDVWLIKSTDGGETWSEAKRVNDDPAGKQQFLSWMTIDQVTGYVYIVFYDRRNYNNNLTDVYMAISRDGGETFSNVRISENSSLARNVGDYTNISAHNNIIRPVWIHSDAQGEKVMTAIIDNPELIVEDKSVGIDMDISPNPFNDNTKISFILEQKAAVSLKVTDIKGATIKVLIDNNSIAKGKHKKTIKSSYLPAPGTYYIELTIGENTAKRKIVYVE
ncbi:MAG: exo-alpha-sialidase [Hyphomicrobiales bacterium]